MPFRSLRLSKSAQEARQRCFWPGGEPRTAPKKPARVQALVLIYPPLRADLESCSREKRGFSGRVDGPKGNLSVIPAALSRSRGALSVTQTDPDRKARLMKGLDSFLERNRDRELFDLVPKEVSK